MSLGASLKHVEPPYLDTRVPIPAPELKIARLARPSPVADRVEEPAAKCTTSLKVGLCRDRLDAARDGTYFRLKLGLARMLRRKLRQAIIEIDDSERLFDTEHGFEITLDPPDPKKVMRLRSAILKLLRSPR
jgi:hypothetical protein